MTLLKKPLIKGNKSKVNFYRNYTWGIFVILLILPLIDIRFGALALISMFLGATQSFFSKGKPYCAYFCPRGGWLKKLLSKFSFGLIPPKFLTNPWFKYTITSLLWIKVLMGLIKATSLSQLGASVYTGFIGTTILAIITGLILRPRTYCGELCHAGNLAGLINKIKK